MHRAKIEILGEKPANEIVRKYLLFPRAKDPSEMNVHSLMMLDSLYHMVQEHDYSEDGNHFSYNLGFSSEHSFYDDIKDVNKWNFLKSCKIFMEFYNTDSRYGWSRSFNVDASGIISGLIFLNTDSSIIREEQNLGVLVKKSEELFELASHLSPEMYGRIQDKVYNNARDNMLVDGINSLHELIELIIEDLKDGIKDHEHREGTS